MELDKKIKIFNIIKVVVIIMAVVYLVTWAIRIANPVLFRKINVFLGLIPSIFDAVMPVKADFGYRKIPMGYVYSAIACVISWFVISHHINTLLDKKRIEAEEQEKKKFINETRNKRAEERKRVRSSIYKNTFYGLFELDVNYSDNFGKDLKQLETLKFGYYKILVKKLQTKYFDVEFVTKDKIFFVSNEYRLMYSITKDILKILNIIIQTSRDNELNVNMLFSYWMDSQNANKMNVFNILSKINSLDNYNKIIISNDVYLKIIGQESIPWCDVESIGRVTLFKVNNNQDLPVDLYKLTSLK